MSDLKHVQLLCTLTSCESKLSLCIMTLHYFPFIDVFTIIRTRYMQFKTSISRQLNSTRSFVRNLKPEKLARKSNFSWTFFVLILKCDNSEKKKTFRIYSDIKELKIHMELDICRRCYSSSISACINFNNFTWPAWIFSLFSPSCLAQNMEVNFSIYI